MNKFLFRVPRSGASAAILALSSLFAFSMQAHGATITGGHATPNSAQLPAANSVAVTYDFDLQYFNNEKGSCGAKIKYSGDAGAAVEEQITINNANKPHQVPRSRSYSVAGDYSATLSGYAFNGMPACLGSATALVKITPPPAKQSGGAPSKSQPAASPPLEVKVTIIKPHPLWLVGGGKLTADVYTNHPVDKCKLTAHLFTVTNDFAAEIGSFELGEVAFPNTQAKPFVNVNIPWDKAPSIGKYRLNIGGSGQCSGGASAEFELKPISGGFENITIHGVELKPYDPQHHYWPVFVNSFNGASGKCTYQIEFKNEKTGKVSVSTQVLKNLPNMDYFSMSDFGPNQGTASGNYIVTVKPVKDPDAQIIACLGSGTASGRIEREAIGGGFDDIPIIKNIKLRMVTGSDSFIVEDSHEYNVGTVKQVLITPEFESFVPGHQMKDCRYSFLLDQIYLGYALGSWKDTDLLPIIKQKMGGLGGGSHELSIHTTAANNDPNHPNCFGKSALHFTVTQGGAISDFGYKTQYETAWDSETLASPHPKYFFTVDIKPEIEGPACAFNIDVTAPSKNTKTFSGLKHGVPGEKQNVQYEYFRNYIYSGTNKDDYPHWDDVYADYDAHPGTIHIYGMKSGNLPACKGDVKRSVKLTPGTSKN